MANSIVFQIALLDDCTMSRVGFESLLPHIPIACNLHHANDLLDLRRILIKEKIRVAVIEPFSTDRALFQFIDFIHWAKNSLPELRIVILTRVQDKKVLRSISKLNVHAFISKNECLAEVTRLTVEAIESNDIFSQIISNVLNSEGESIATCLTDSELIVLSYFLRGIKQKQIADLTNRSVKTISCHKRNAMRKLGVKGNTGLIAFAKTVSGNSLLSHSYNEV